MSVASLICLVVWWKFKILVACFVMYNKCVYIIEKILEKNFFFQCSANNSWDAFSIWPGITPEKSLHCGVMMSHWPNFKTIVAKLYPKLWSNDEPLIFSVWLELIIVNWMSFQRWFSEVAPVTWYINFISRSYGWGLRARFTIFCCFLSLLDDIYFFIW